MSNNVKKVILVLAALLLSGAMFYFALPKIKELNEEQVKVLVFSNDMLSERVITENDLTEKLMTKKDVDFEVLSKEDLVGNYTKSFVYAGDIATEKKIIPGVNKFDEKAYLTLKVATEQALAGELIEGDIITIFSYDEETEQTYDSEYLKYVEVVRVKNRLTENIAEVKEQNLANDMGVAYKSDSIIPVYVTVKVNDRQAMELIDSSQKGFFYFAYRGNIVQNERLLDIQNEVFMTEEETGE